jgi:hypothetical protein
MIESKIYGNGSAALEDDCLPEIPSRGNELGLIDLLVLLASRKLLIAKTTGLALVVGLIAALLQPVTYTATTRIMPPQQTQSAAAMMMSQLTGSRETFASGLRKTIEWYLGNLDWVEHVTSGSYREWINLQYNPSSPAGAVYQ